MKKESILFLIICFLPMYAFSQEKTYNGPFWQGTAQYKYVQSTDLTRIFNGDFRYVHKDGQIVTGKYRNDLKDGEWVSNLWGITEIINYKDGKRHGDYSLSYKDKDKEIKINAVFSENCLDTLSYYSKDNQYGIIKGNAGRYGISSKPWEQYIYSKHYLQFFSNNIFIGDISQDLTTGDFSRPLEEIAFLSTYVEKNIDDDGTFFIESENEIIYYKLESVKYLMFYQFVLDFPIDYLPEKALIPIFFYHNFWDVSLCRGEVPLVFFPILKIVEDKEKTEKEKLKRINEGIKRRSAEEFEKKKIEKELQDKEREFGRTDYGQMIIKLKKDLSLTVEKYEEKIQFYLNDYLRHCEISSVDSPRYIDDNLYEIICKYNNLKFEKYNEINIPELLKNSLVIVIPIDIGFKGNDFIVTKAMILYLNDGISTSLLRYMLKDNVYLGKLTESNKESICRGNITIECMNNMYYFNSKIHSPRGVNDIILHELDLTKKLKKKMCYYSIWINNDLKIESPITKLDKLEVQKSFIERNSKMSIK